LEERAKQVLPGSEGGGGGEEGVGGTVGRNYPSNVCTYEYMNFKKASLQLKKKRFLEFC
jgi:hypothetical protein